MGLQGVEMILLGYNTFARHRRPEHYRLIVDRVGAEPPEEPR